MEVFLAKAPEIEEGGHAGPPQRKRIEEFRKKLEAENRELTARFQRKISRSELKEKINPLSWNTWIKPLQFVEMNNGTVILFHENPIWVQDHYGEAISEVLGKPVKVINQEQKKGKGNDKSIKGTDRKRIDNCQKFN